MPEGDPGPRLDGTSGGPDAEIVPLCRLCRTPIAYIFALALLSPLAARSWSDLDAGERAIYGREREEKLPIRLFLVEKEDWQDHYAFHIFFLWGTKNYPRYKSSRVFPFYYALESKIDNRYLLVTPLYHRETDLAERDESLLWLYYWGERGETAKKYSGLFPLYYYSDYRADSPFLLTPAFWYSRHSRSAAGSTYSVGIPLIPVILWDSSPTEYDLILFYLMRQRSRSGDTLSHLLPLYYYDRDAGGSLFISPLYYAHVRQEAAAHALLWLVYWGSREQTGHHGVFPLYYYAYGPNESTLASPLYWKWRGDNSYFELFIPLFLSYQKRDYSLHVNAAGLSFSEEKLNTLPVGVQVRGEKISLDSDVGWLYSFFRISTRGTIATGSASETQVTTAKKAAAPVTPQVTAKRARNRDDSDSFFGTYALFGIFAYERADHFRHFRLLPLSWLTWDANNDTGVQTLLPFYIHYKDEAVRYLVVGAVVPLYGKQQKFHKDCTSEISTFAVIVYWDEFDCENKTAEKTVLWPLVNHYEAAEKGGYRIFPFFWKKWWSEAGRERQLLFSPLHYTHIEGGNYSTLSWLFYTSRSNYDSTFGIWALYHRSRAHDGSAQTTYVFPVYFSTNEYPNTTGNPHREALFTFAGIFWRFHETQDSEDEFTMHLSPAYLYFGDKRRDYLFSWLYYDTHSARHRTVGVPLLFHRRSDADGSYSNWYVIPVYYSRQTLRSGDAGSGGDSTVFWLFPLYYGERSPGYALDNFAFLAGRKTNTTADIFSWNALLYTVWHTRQQRSTDFRLAYSLLFNYADNEHDFSWHFALIGGYKYYRDGSYTRHHLLPLWWHSRSGNNTDLYLPFALTMFTDHDNGNRLFRAVLLGILYYHSSDAAAYDQTEFALLGSLYYHNKNFEIDPATNRERRFDSYGSLWGALWHYETEENYRRFSILTFLYSRSEKDGVVRHKIFGLSL